MMEWQEFKRFPISIDLSKVSGFLREQGVIHKFTEENDSQVLWLQGQYNTEMIADFITRFIDGDVHIEKTVVNDSRTLQAFFTEFLAYPITALIISLGFVGYLMDAVFRSRQLFEIFSFMPIEVIFGKMQLWRLLTPTFFHFGVAHFIFNAIWIYLLGRQLESVLSRANFLGVFLFTAVAANVLQYLVQGSIYFGGLSGVFYGYLGFLSVTTFVFKTPSLLLQPAIIYVCMGTMALGFMGAMDWLSSGGIANWAHLGGFIAGIIYAFTCTNLKRNGS